MARCRVLCAGSFLTFHFSFFSLNAHPLLSPLVMISRTLGPEVGGSIGLMFYLANVCGCAVSLLGLVEAMLDTFGTGQCSPPGCRQLCGFAGSGVLGSVGREALFKRKAKWSINWAFLSYFTVCPALRRHLSACLGPQGAYPIVGDTVLIPLKSTEQDWWYIPPGRSGMLGYSREGEWERWPL